VWLSQGLVWQKCSAGPWSSFFYLCTYFCPLLDFLVCISWTFLPRRHDAGSGTCSNGRSQADWVVRWGREVCLTLFASRNPSALHWEVIRRFWWLYAWKLDNELKSVISISYTQIKVRSLLWTTSLVVLYSFNAGVLFTALLLMKVLKSFPEKYAPCCYFADLLLNVAFASLLLNISENPCNSHCCETDGEKGSYALR
jgi:hypothetical protein